MFNELECELTCPSCGASNTVFVELFFGGPHMRKYILLEKITWGLTGRPEHGDIASEGYTDCPACGKDFFVQVLVKSDVILEAIPDRFKEGHIR